MPDNDQPIMSQVREALALLDGLARRAEALAETVRAEARGLQEPKGGVTPDRMALYKEFRNAVRKAEAQQAAPPSLEDLCGDSAGSSPAVYRWGDRAALANGLRNCWSQMIGPPRTGADEQPLRRVLDGWLQSLGAAANDLDRVIEALAAGYGRAYGEEWDPVAWAEVPDMAASESEAETRPKTTFERVNALLESQQAVNAQIAHRAGFWKAVQPGTAPFAASSSPPKRRWFGKRSRPVPTVAENVPWAELKLNQCPANPAFGPLIRDRFVQCYSEATIFTRLSRSLAESERKLETEFESRQKRLTKVAHGIRVIFPETRTHHAELMAKAAELSTKVTALMANGQDWVARTTDRLARPLREVPWAGRDAGTSP
jgi:hypothetical protein